MNKLNLLCAVILSSLLSLGIDSTAQTPANNNCISAAPLIQNTNCTVTSGSTTGATVSAGSLSNCEDYNDGDIWFSFTATDDSAVVSLNNITATNTNASLYYFGIAAYSGTCGALTEIDCNNGGHSNTPSNISAGDMPLELLLTNLTIGQTVYIKLWESYSLDNALNFVANDLNFDICVSKVPSPPACTALISPVNGTTMVIYPIVQTTFSWDAATGATSYLLYLDTIVTAPNANNTIQVYGTSAVLNNLFPFNKTYYWYVIPVNAGGMATGCASNIRSFTTQATPPAPSNDLCAGALPLVSGMTGLNQAATGDTSLPFCGSASAGTFKGLWYSFTPTSTGTLTIGICDAQFDSYIRIFSGTCSSLACVASADDGCAASITGASSVTFSATANQPYYALVGSKTNVGYGTFTFSTTGVSLPIKMSPLAGTVQGNGVVLLSWNTYSENNNYGFEIQRSTDGIHFNRIGFVATKTENGNSNENLAYRYADDEKIKGNAFYRVMQTDLDGAATFSNIVQLYAKQNEGFDITVAPNPVKDAVLVRIYGPTENQAIIRITDLTGKLLRTFSVKGPETLIDMNDLTSGFYLIQYTDAAHNRTFKINKQ